MGQDTNPRTQNEIDELKAQIHSLKEKNLILNKIIFKAPIPIFVLDKDHKITHFNQALEELADLDGKKLLGTREQWKAFYSKPRPVMADLIIDKSSDNEIVEHYGIRYNRSPKSLDRFAATDFFPDLSSDGKWLYFTASPFNDSQGKIAGAVETLQDVTQEKIQEHRLRELYNTYRNILEFIPYPIIVYDDKGKISYANPSFTRVFGWTIEEIEGTNLDFIPPNLKQETHDVMDQFRHDKQLTRYETQRLTKTGAVRDVIIWADTHTPDHIGETFVILRDVTEEKRLAANNQTIMRISAALPEYPDLKDLMNYITREVKDLLKVEGAVVLLYDEIKADLFFLGIAYDDLSTERRAREVRFNLDEVFAGQVIKTGNPAVTNNAEELTTNYPERDRKLGYQTRSILCAPIRSDSRIIGVLCAINKKQNLFDDNDMELMTMIAGTVAISIENARFSDALKEAYRDVASMNRAKGKAINHLSHELKTPVAILAGSLKILRKKIQAAPNIKLDSTLDRIERNLDRIVDIQAETADIIESGAYQTRQLLLKMLEACQDELETLIETCLDQGIVEPDHLIHSVATLIDEKFGPRSMRLEPVDFKKTFAEVYAAMIPKFHFRRIDITHDIPNSLPDILLPPDVATKIIEGLIKNAIENTPDQGKIDISARAEGDGLRFEVKDFGVGIEPDHRKRIFEGFFTTQDTLLYSTKNPFEFGAGGKGADLLRMKLFADRLGFIIKMTSQRCRFLVADGEPCPGDIRKCQFCTSQSDCLDSGQTLFSIFFPNGEK